MAFIHHTVSANDYGPEDSAAMVLGICRYHRNSNGWNDIGYNFLVDRYGTIFEGRAGGIDEAVVGAQAQGYNSQSTGIASIGTFSTDGPDRGRARALARLLGWKLTLHGVPPAGRCPGPAAARRTASPPAQDRTFERISGHRDADATACPGNGALCAARAAARDGQSRPAARGHPDRREAPTRRNVPYGQKAVLQLGLQPPETPLAGARVDVQMLGRLGWRTQHSVSTDAAGSAQTRVRVSSNRTCEAAMQATPGCFPPARPR